MLTFTPSGPLRPATMYTVTLKQNALHLKKEDEGKELFMVSYYSVDDGIKNPSMDSCHGRVSRSSSSLLTTRPPGPGPKPGPKGPPKPGPNGGGIISFFCASLRREGLLPRHHGVIPRSVPVLMKGGDHLAGPSKKFGRIRILANFRR